MSLQERRARLDSKQHRTNTGTRVLEWVLCAAALWGGLVMAWMPTALRENPPPFYRVINSYFDAWLIGLAIGLVPIVHVAGLLLSRCPARHSEDCEVVGVDGTLSRSQHIGAFLRRVGALGQCGVWGFLTTIYVLLWIQKHEVTFGSGVCVIFAVCASIASYCVSKEHSRQHVRGEVARIVSQNEGKPRQALEQLREMT